VLPRFVAAIVTPLLESKLYACSVAILFLLAPSMCFVFCVLPSLWCCFTARDGIPRFVTAPLRFVDAARVWFLNVARMNGTMTTNGLRDERMKACHGWWRQIQRRFWIVSCLLVVFLSLSCGLRECMSVRNHAMAPRGEQQLRKLTHSLFNLSCKSAGTVGGGFYNSVHGLYV